MHTKTHTYKHARPHTQTYIYIERARRKYDKRDEEIETEREMTREENHSRKKRRKHPLLCQVKSNRDECNHGDRNNHRKECSLCKSYNTPIKRNYPQSHNSPHIEIGRRSLPRKKLHLEEECPPPSPQSHASSKAFPPAYSLYSEI